MSSPPVSSHVDVLIIGAGPAGLMAATWFSRTGLKCRIIDKRGTKIFNGQADGLQCRTLEILDSFGFGHRAWREANHMLEVCLWNPDERGVICRSDRFPDSIPGLSRFHECVLHQGRIERFFLDSIQGCSDIRVERGVLPTSLEIDDSLVEDPHAHPVTARVRHLSEEEATPTQASTSANGTIFQDGLFRSNLAPDDTEDLIANASLDKKANTEEVIRAKYVIGADGAHSWTRKQLDFELRGEQTDYIWGVLDCVPITDFPDIRSRCAIHSANSGSVMVIPRENKLVRLYIQMTTTEKIGEAASRVDRSEITPEAILASAQRILAPYKITYRKLDWWTAYQIGQRVAERFSAKERVLLVGDAVHQHSPKAGQGMNVSMCDAYNLGWKISSVVKGQADRSILKTYELERSRVAHDLIRFDHKFSRLFSGRPARDVIDEAGISMAKFKQVFEKGIMFASGVAVNYQASLLVAKPFDASDGEDLPPDVTYSQSKVTSSQHLASKITVGMRIPSVKVLSQADARPWHLQELLPSNGRWRVILFPGDISLPAQKQKLDQLAASLAAPTSLLKRFTPPGSRYDEIFEVLTVHAAPRVDFTVFDFPEVLRPFDEVDGWDYHKIFVDDQSYHEGHGRLYETFGIDPAVGCVVAARPDQYVSLVGEMGYEQLDAFFSGFMIPQST